MKRGGEERETRETEGISKEERKMVNREAQKKKLSTCFGSLLPFFFSFLVFFSLLSLLFFFSVLAAS
jgi:hypothetical protein